jgi:hypothetical protein
MTKAVNSTNQHHQRVAVAWEYNMKLQRTSHSSSQEGTAISSGTSHLQHLIHLVTGISLLLPCLHVAGLTAAADGMETSDVPQKGRKKRKAKQPGLQLQSGVA